MPHPCNVVCPRPRTCRYSQDQATASSFSWILLDRRPYTYHDLFLDLWDHHGIYLGHESSLVDEEDDHRKICILGHGLDHRSDLSQFSPGVGVHSGLGRRNRHHDHGHGHARARDGFCDGLDLYRSDVVEGRHSHRRIFAVSRHLTCTHDLRGRRNLDVDDEVAPHPLQDLCDVDGKVAPRRGDLLFSYVAVESHRRRRRTCGRGLDDPVGDLRSCLDLDPFSTWICGSLGRRPRDLQVVDCVDLIEDSLGPRRRRGIFLVVT